MKTETSISGEKALRLLEAVGMEGTYMEGGDYYIATDEDGRDYLTCGGYDEPFAEVTGVEGLWG